MAEQVNNFGRQVNRDDTWTRGRRSGGELGKGKDSIVIVK